MPNGPPFMMSNRRGEVVGRWFDSVPQEVLFSKEATYQSPSKCQIGSRSQCPSASSGKRSQRCSPVGGQAEQGPVGRVSSSLNTVQTSERETLPCMGRVTAILFRLSSVPPEIVYVKHRVWIREVSMGFSNSPYSLVWQRCLHLKAGWLHSLKVDTLGT